MFIVTHMHLSNFLQHFSCNTSNTEFNKISSVYFGDEKIRKGRRTCRNISKYIHFSQFVGINNMADVCIAFFNIKKPSNLATQCIYMFHLFLI
jgi:hypothetical protein